MSKARQLADLLDASGDVKNDNLGSIVDANGDIVVGALDNVPEPPLANRAVFTANGNINAGDFVVLNSDTTVSAASLYTGSVGDSFPLTKQEVDLQGIHSRYAVSFDPFDPSKLIIMIRPPVYGYFVRLLFCTMQAGKIIIENIQQTSLGGNGSSNVGFFEHDPHVQNRVVLVYQDTSGYDTVVVGTISNNEITFGTPYTTPYVASTYFWFKLDPHTQDRFVMMADDGNQVIVAGTLSGTSVSGLGSPVTYEGNTASENFFDFDPFNANKAVLTYCDDTSDDVEARVVTLSGTSISLGAVKTVYASTAVYMSYVAYSKTVPNSLLFYYSAVGENDSAVAATVSGTTITIGTPILIGGQSTNDVQTTIASDPIVSNKFVAVNGASVIEMDVSGTSISLTSINTGLFDTPYYPTISYVPNKEGQLIYLAQDPANQNRLTAFAMQYATDNAELSNVSDTILGISETTTSNGDEATIVLASGITTDVSGLTTGASYYVLPDGNLTTTNTGVYAGIALSPTSLLIKG